jgi:hypothetical protein
MFVKANRCSFTAYQIVLSVWEDFFHTQLLAFCGVFFASLWLTGLTSQANLFPTQFSSPEWLQRGSTVEMILRRESSSVTNVVLPATLGSRRQSNLLKTRH